MLCEKMLHVSDMIRDFYGQSTPSPEGVLLLAAQVRADLNVSKEYAILLVREALANRDRRS